MKLRSILAALGAAALTLSGCSVPNTYDGYVHVECDATDANKVTVCRSTEKPVPTVTQTVTVTPSPTATATTQTPVPTATTQTPVPTATTQAPAAITPAAPSSVVNGRTLSFVDEFSGTTLDRAKWSPCWFYPTCGSMNNATTPTSNVSVSGGNLVLALPDAGHGSLVSTNPKGGGGLAGWTFTTGYVETRAFFPGNGTACYNWPAWWSVGQSWPSTQEVDIAEAKGGKMLANYMNSAGTWQSYAVPGSWCNGWHTYGLNRTASTVEFYYDGALVKTMATNETPAPHYLILNNGSGNGAPALYGVGAQVKVDYVHAWK